MLRLMRALASDKRLLILDWLREPRAHFPAQTDGDPEADGVCVVFIARKLHVSQPTATEHLRILSDVGLVVPRRIRQWTFYRRDEAGVRRARDTVLARL